ncbi:protein kinase [Nonomuraea sp. JJY05]|uniref:protein kinase domain-containing protein n=1 Tax=Nonomuraea sp. JJY05 TaxID=3350255 RepID=UPI00373F0908
MSDPRPLAENDPRQLGDYRLIGVLGVGGQGVVYLGQAPSGQRVAVKTLHARMASEPEALERFLRETEIAGSVAAFCTARVVAAGIAGSAPYLVSEYVQGPSLEELVTREGPRTGGGLDRLAITTLVALDAIHRAGIVHRDFKPGNVIMGQEGPVVIDFGIARVLDHSTTGSGLIGTPAYLAPEQLNGEPAGAPSDVFAWAATMVYAATGHRAFSGTVTAGVLNAIMTREPDLAGVPARLRPLLAAGLAKDPASRPSVTDLFTALTHETPLQDMGARRSATPPENAPRGARRSAPRPENAPRGARRSAPSPESAPRGAWRSAPPPENAPHPRRRPPGLAKVFAAAAVVLVIPVALWLTPVLTGVLPGATPSTAGTTTKPAATGAPFGTLIREPVNGWQSWVLSLAVGQWDGRPVVASGGYDGTVLISDLATGAPLHSPFTGHQGPVWSVATGQVNGRPVVVSGGRDGTVRVWDQTTGEPIGKPFQGHRGSVESVAVGQVNGRPVAVSGGLDGTVRVSDLATGDQIGDPVGTGTGRGWVLSVAVGEVNGRPVVVSGDVDGNVLMTDLATGTPMARRVNAHQGPVESATVARLDGRPVAISGGGRGDHTVRVWDLATGEPIGHPFRGHRSWALGLAAGQLNDGRPIVVSGGYNDQTVRVWDLATGKPIGEPFDDHRGLIEAVALAHLDGRLVAVSGGNDGKVRVWSLSSPYPSP